MLEGVMLIYFSEIVENMRVNKYTAVAISTILILATFVFALPNLVPATVDKAKEPVPVTIPAHAVEIADDVFSLGSVKVNGQVLQGYAFVYRKGFAKPPWAGGGGTTTSTCFSVFAKGAKWKTAEPWVVNPANTEGLGSAFVLSNLDSSVSKWEDAADGTVGSGSINILGSGSTISDTLVADTSSPDGVNEVYFGDVGSSGAIAVTIVWGIFIGPPSGRELVEWDQVYDQVDFNWSSTGEAGKMDFENINTHELGHTVGLGHPSDECTEETMFRFASFGETKKRTLNAGDIAGVDSLY